MATTDQELKKLNQTVGEAVNILKLYIGNSAQVKAMTEKEREVIEGWLKVTDMAADNQKQQRAFTERARDEHGRFIKKQDKATNEFMGMAQSVKGLITGMVSGIKNGVKNMVSGLMNHVSNFFQAIKSHFLSLFGEESEWFQLMGAIKDSITGIAGSIIGFFWQKTPNWAKKMIKTLQGMYALQIKQMKKEWLDMSSGAKKQGGVWGILAGILLGIAAGIGAWLHRHLVLLSRLPIFSKIARMFEAIDDIPFIGKLFKAVKFGFRWLGWPLTILLSAIDFIRAYQETEGSTWEKIKAGLWAAVSGFIELPIRFIGWVTEKVLGWFGVEADGIADKMMSGIKSMFDTVIKGWELIFSEILTPMLDGMKFIFTKIWNAFMDGAIALLSKFGVNTSLIEKMKIGETTSPDVLAADAENTKLKAQKQAEYEKKNDQRLEELQKSSIVQDTQNKTYLGKLMNMIGGGDSGGGGDVKQVPDELDNYLIGMGAMSGGIDE